VECQRVRAGTIADAGGDRRPHGGDVQRSTAHLIEQLVE
jgi:hypothetical protein